MHAYHVTVRGKNVLEETSDAVELGTFENLDFSLYSVPWPPRIKAIR